GSRWARSPAPCSRLWCDLRAGNAPRNSTFRSHQGPSQRRADGVQLGEEGELQRPPQEGRSRAPPGAGLQADDPLDGLEVPEAPELEVVLQVDELLAGLVRRPIARSWSTWRTTSRSTSSSQVSYADQLRAASP